MRFLTVLPHMKVGLEKEKERRNSACKATCGLHQVICACVAQGSRHSFNGKTREVYTTWATVCRTGNGAPICRLKGLEAAEGYPGKDVKASDT